MSSSGTISNLQQALNCAGKCDCCEKLQQQINRLNQQINNLKAEDINQKERLNKLEKKINDLEAPRGFKQQPPDNSLVEIYKRLAKLEKDTEALKIGIVQTLYNFADIEEVNREFTQAFQALYEMFIPIVEFVGSLFGFLGEQ